MGARPPRKRLFPVLLDGLVFAFLGINRMLAPELVGIVVARSFDGFGCRLVPVGWVLRFLEQPLLDYTKQTTMVSPRMYIP